MKTSDMKNFIAHLVKEIESVEKNVNSLITDIPENKKHFFFMFFYDKVYT